MAGRVVVTIIVEDGETFIDVTCSQGRDVSVVEAVGICEVGKALLLEQV